ncbi:MAG: hypothetical protein J6Y02_14685 [Pseudobutyrivibrio sp.]|nr:hypothetical protein [Pseudobutyrivibrio sp.]
MAGPIIKSFIKFKDGTILPTLAVYSRKEYYDGANREIFDIRMPDDQVTFAQIQAAIATEGNTSDIHLIEAHYDRTTGALIEEMSFHHPYYNYVIESGEREDDGLKFIGLKLARLTDDEQYQAINDEEIHDQEDAIIELAELISG